jgi:hypothetical protein
MQYGITCYFKIAKTLPQANLDRRSTGQEHRIKVSFWCGGLPRSAPLRPLSSRYSAIPG